MYLNLLGIALSSTYTRSATSALVNVNVAATLTYFMFHIQHETRVRLLHADVVFTGQGLSFLHAHAMPVCMLGCNVSLIDVMLLSVRNMSLVLV